MGRTSDARQRLMDAAYDLIWEYSYGSVTIEAICERAGVKKGSFYYFFDSKSELAVTALNAWWMQRRMVLEEIFSSETPPLERIRNYIDFIVGRQIESFETTGQVLGCPLHGLGAEIATQDENLLILVRSIMKASASYFEQAILQAQALGQIDGGAAAHKARAAMGLYCGSLVQARIENDPSALRSLSHEILELIGGQDALDLGPLTRLMPQASLSPSR